MKNLLNKILRKLGWGNCPNCKSFIKPIWVNDWLYDPDEPPMFYHYECPKCFARTDIMPSKLTEKAVKQLGFNSFEEYTNELIK